MFDTLKSGTNQKPLPPLNLNEPRDKPKEEFTCHLWHFAAGQPDDAKHPFLELFACPRQSHMGNGSLRAKEGECTVPAMRNLTDLSHLDSAILTVQCCSSTLLPNSRTCSLPCVTSFNVTSPPPHLTASNRSQMRQ